MQTKQKKPLQVAITGMNGRSYKMMVMFFQGPCKGSAVVVRDDEAEVEIIDADTSSVRSGLAKKISARPDRPVIVLSLENPGLDEVIFVKKPVQTDKMLAALELARKQIIQQEKKRQFSSKSTGNSYPESSKAQEKSEKTSVRTTSSEQPTKQKVLDFEEQKKTSKHKTAMQLDEKGYSAFIGSALEIDFNDPKQVLNASYNPTKHYQGYVHSAMKLSLTKGQVLSLETGWKSLILLPHSYEMWIDADDKQIKAFAALPAATIAEIGHTGKGITVKPVDAKQQTANMDLKRFQAMDAFLWKLSLWTSKGRYPSKIDINKPVYLKRWPNMTRFVVTPHAMRIAALLVNGPRTLLNTAEILNIKPQYVFSFFSAAYALGLAGQAEREVDNLVAVSKSPTSNKKGLLGKIMSRLRGSK